MMYYKRLYGRSIIGVYLDKLGFEILYLLSYYSFYLAIYRVFFSVIVGCSFAINIRNS